MKPLGLSIFTILNPPIILRYLSRQVFECNNCAMLISDLARAGGFMDTTAAFLIICQ
jgi:hypothetical protein